ncbi:MAG TPA: hypothetical protein VID48_01765 [Solirubrobacteraceae bacterium]|jgi:hypothetical protein
MAANLSAVMSYTAAQGREQILQVLAGAAEEIASALASLSEAHERLDDHSAERLEGDLFRSVQLAYGRAQRTYSDFADRSGLETRVIQPRPAGAPSGAIKSFIDSAIAAVEMANSQLAELQDSMLPVEVGDAQLRAGIADIRGLIDGLRGRAREFVRTLGR